MITVAGWVLVLLAGLGITAAGLGAVNSLGVRARGVFGMLAAALGAVLVILALLLAAGP